MSAGPASQPQRTCIGCGAKKLQSEFMRLTSAQGGTPRLDVTGKLPGRGAYLCPQAECVEKAWKRRAVERALKLQESVPAMLKEECLERLKEYFVM